MGALRDVGRFGALVLDGVGLWARGLWALGLWVFLGFRLGVSGLGLRSSCGFMVWASFGIRVCVSDFRVSEVSLALLGFRV